MPLVAGVDCSTQSTKVLVVDAEDGHVVATGAAVHEVEGVGGARETDPRDWERSVASALAQTGRAGEVAVDINRRPTAWPGRARRGGRPLRKAPLWNDTRGAPDAEDLVDSIGGPEACAKRVGSVLTSSFTVAHWAWLRRTEPDLAAAARYVMLPHDYLNFRLTGSPATDRSDVSGTGWWSPTDEAYAPDVLALEAVRLDPALLPPVIAPEGVAGSVTRRSRTAVWACRWYKGGVRRGRQRGRRTGPGLRAGGSSFVSWYVRDCLRRRSEPRAPTPRVQSPVLPVPTAGTCR